MTTRIGPLLLGVAALMTACTLGQPGLSALSSASPPPVGTSSPPPAWTAAPTSSVPRRDVSIADAARCPTTKPGKAPAEIGTRLFGSGSAHGNRDLWVGGLWPNGVLAVDRRFIEPDGSVRMKFGWWRNLAGQLVITGRRLDAPAPPLESVVPDGYGTSGFQATSVFFPTEGCWEVTGQVGSANLTFVTFVIKTG